MTARRVVGTFPHPAGDTENGDREWRRHPHTTDCESCSWTTKPHLREFMRTELPRLGHEVTVCPDGKTGIEAREEGRVRRRHPRPAHGHDKAGLQVLAALKQVSPDTEAVIMTGYGSTETAVEALRLGAFDYLTKPCKLTDIEALLLRIQEKRKLKHKTAALESRVQAAEGPAGLIGRQPGDAAGAAVHRPHRPDRRPRAHHRRDRHRQGSGRPRALHARASGRTCRSCRSTAAR